MDHVRGQPALKTAYPLRVHFAQERRAHGQAQLFVRKAPTRVGQKKKKEEKLKDKAGRKVGEGEDGGEPSEGDDAAPVDPASPGSPPAA